MGRTMKRDLILRFYQTKASDYIMTSKRCVLAMAPNGGKTEVSIDVIGRFLKENPDSRVLVLTHSTNVLLSNYVDRLDELNVDFTYGSDFSIDTQVHISLPHSQHQITGEYGLVIVDEAHENYLAKRVNDIITKVNPTQELLLTGTPSKFIGKSGYDIYAMAANEISGEYSAKVQVELVASDYSWVGHYNNELEINNKFHFSLNDTEATLNSVIKQLVKRLTLGYDPKEFNNPTLLTRLKSWALTYKNIGKTLVICRTIKQGNQVYNIMKKHGVNVGLSHSKSDNDSVVVNDFKDGVYDVLIVVNRARLGYSDDNLMNIIDLGGSHNPNILYQSIMRLSRGTPDKQKFYLKVTPKESYNMALTEISMDAALMLTSRGFLLTYNGKNFNGIKIPVLKSKKGGLITGGKRTGGNKKPNLPTYTNDVVKMFRDILHDLTKPVSIYKMVTIRSVKEQLGYISVRKHTRESIFASAMGVSYEE